MGLQINLDLQQQLIVMIVSLPLGLHPSPLRGFVLLHLGLCPSPLGPLACIWPIFGFSSLDQVDVLCFLKVAVHEESP